MTALTPCSVLLEDLVKRLNEDMPGKVLEHEAADMLLALSQQAAVSRRLAIEEAAKIIRDNQQTFSSEIGRHLTARIDDNRDGLAYADAINALSPTLDRDALTERAAEALWEAYRTDEGSPNALPVTWAAMPDDLKRLPRLQARAVIIALIGEP